MLNRWFFLGSNIPWVSQRRFRNRHRCLLGCQKCLLLLVLHNVKKKLFSASFPCFILYVHCQRVNFKSFHVFSEARTHRSWIHVGVECSVIQVCIETSHFPRNRGTPRRQCEVASLSSEVFERRTSTGNGRFALLSCDFEQIFGQIVSVRIKTLGNINTVASRLIKRGKGSLPVDVRRSKTSMLRSSLFYVLSSVNSLPTSPFTGTDPEFFFRRGCTRLLLYFNTNKPHIVVFYFRIPVD